MELPPLFGTFQFKLIFVPEYEDIGAIKSEGIVEGTTEMPRGSVAHPLVPRSLIAATLTK